MSSFYTTTIPTSQNSIGGQISPVGGTDVDDSSPISTGITPGIRPITVMGAPTVTQNPVVAAAPQTLPNTVKYNMSMPSVGFNPQGISIPGKNGDISFIAGSNINIQPQGSSVTISASIPANVLLNGLNAYQPLKISDVKAASNTIYYSTTTNKLTYKDPAGTLHTFY